MKRITFTTIKTLGVIENAVYVIGQFGKGEVAVYVARDNAEFARYSSIGGWQYTTAYDVLSA
jgi:hypothetical protein